MGSRGTGPISPAFSWPSGMEREVKFTEFFLRVPGRGVRTPNFGTPRGSREGPNQLGVHRTPFGSRKL